MGKWLLKYLAVRKAYFEFRIIPDNIFLSKNARIMTDAMTERIIKNAGAKCNIPSDIRISAHTFRHTYAQYQLKNGLDIYTLSRLLGHEKVITTQVYLNGLRDKEILEQAQRTSPLMNL